MRKSDVEFHRLGYGYNSVPAINVKCYHFDVEIADIVKKFDTDRESAEKALEFAWETAQEAFWDNAREAVHDIFGSGFKVYSEGRSAGWLYVEGLPDVATWDAIQLGKWVRLNKWCRDEIKSLTSRDYILGEIETNEWYKPGSEKYNFVETIEGRKTIADLKEEARKAGFGPVLRK